MAKSYAEKLLGQAWALKTTPFLCYNKQIKAVFLNAHYQNIPMRLHNLIKNRAFAGTAIGIIITILISIFVSLSIFQSWHLKLADTLYTRSEPSDKIVIIAIDESSTQPILAGGLGRYAQWSRDNFTKLLDVLKSQQPATIVFDILFNNATQSIPFENISLFNTNLKDISNKEKLQAYENFINENYNPVNNAIDNRFAEKLKEFNNIILIFSANENGPIFPLQKFSETATIAAYNIQPDKDGMVRQSDPLIEFENKLYGDIALATAKEYLNIESLEEIEIPLEDGKMNINYFADPFGYQMIPFVKVLNNDFPSDFFKDKIVLIGVTAFREIQDDVLTPRSNHIPMPGIEVRANQIQTIIEGKFLINQSKTAQLITIAVIAILLTIAFNYLGIIFSILLTIFAIIAYILAAHFFYRKGIILSMVYPFLTIVLSYLAAWVYRYFIADKSKREIKSMFGHYMGKEFVEEISKNPDTVKLGGERKTVTVFFSDIKDSTGISEKTNTESWVAQINEYFTVMEKILKDSGGTLDKYEGDAIMGFWNAPISQEDHVARAYSAALQMQKALVGLNQKWQGEGRPTLEFRIGINTGEAIVGNFGSADRFDYTVMGDTVNTASRLENCANKTYGTKIIVAGGAKAGAGSSAGPESDSGAQFILRELDTVFLPGKKEPVTIFELLCIAQELAPEISNLTKIYSEGLAAYRKHDFAEAVEKFEYLKDDHPSQIMLARCQKLNAGQGLSEVDENMVFRIVGK